MRLKLIASVALNLLLLCGMVVARVDTDRAEGFRYTDANGSAFVQESRFDDDALKILGLASMRAELERTTQPESVDFWRSGFAPAAQELSASIARDQRLRDWAIANFGANAENDPAFDSIFRPLGRSYDFLSSADQLTLQQAQLDRLRRSRGENAGNALARGQCTFAAGDAVTQAGLMQPVWAELGAPAQIEYRLRFSTLADQLRSLELDWTEQMYRSLFGLLVEIESAREPRVQYAKRKELRERLGSRNFDLLWSKRDPFFRALADYLGRREAGQSSVMQAYAIVNRTQESMLAAASGARNDTSVVASISKLKQQESTLLAELLGEDVAAGLSAALIQAASDLGKSRRAC